MQTSIIKPKCPYCGVSAEIHSTSMIGNDKLITLKCKHGVVEKALGPKLFDVDPYAALRSRKGKSLRDFQIRTVKKIEEAGGNIIVAHEMGLGKTVCSLATLKMHPEMHPVLFVVKAGLVAQWTQEIIDWLGPEFVPQVIMSGKDKLYLDVFKCVIVSYDTLSRVSWLDSTDFKTIVLDECQQVKNGKAARTQAARRIAKSTKYRLPLSGTPIKNNAGEYFTALNMVDPLTFHTEAAFLTHWVDSWDNGYAIKSGGIRRSMLQKWNEWTDKKVVRYLRHEVAPELPLIDRHFQFSNLSKTVENAYAAAHQQFEEAWMDSVTNIDGGNKFEEQSNIMAWLSRMRHITGVSKVGPTCEFIQDFLEQTDRKIAVFIHHREIPELIDQTLGFKTLKIASTMDADQRAAAIEKFRTDPTQRVMVLSTLASGEGINLQFCEDAIIMERQWNPANEEQAEARFTRIGSNAARVTITYMVATGTIDEYFAEIVERKREIVSKTMDGQAAAWDKSSIMQELAETCIREGRKRWARK